MRRAIHLLCRLWRASRLKTSGVSLAVLAVFQFGISGVWAATGEQTPTAVVQQLVGSVGLLASANDQEDRDKLNDTIDKSLATAPLARRVLGPTWKKIDASQRARFVTLLTRLLEVVAYPRASDFFHGLQIKYQGEQKTRDGAVVPTIVSFPKSGEVKIDYLMEHIDGRWQIADINLDGRSLADGVSEQVQTLLKQGSYNDLVAKMQARVGQAQSEQAPPTPMSQ